MEAKKKQVNSKKQLFHIYAITTTNYFHIAGASWVALLALRGFSLLEIGMLESIFHIVSFCFEIPSGVVADVFGRKKTMILSSVVTLLSCIGMIFSGGFFTTAIAIGLNALSYNLSSGTREALAYDSLKLDGRENEYNKFSSTDTMLYRITNSTATLLAGFALYLGYQKAYAIDSIFTVISLFFAFQLVATNQELPHRQTVKEVIHESALFLRSNKRARWIMIINAFIGSISTLVLFFLQAKLPLAGLSNSLLGPALFFMGMGAALGAKLVPRFEHINYKLLLVFAMIAVSISFSMSFTGNPWFMIAGGFIGAFGDDFIQVRTDVLLNEMIPSEQRATLVSVSSFLFSVIMIVMSTLLGWVMG